MSSSASIERLLPRLRSERASVSVPALQSLDFKLKHGLLLLSDLVQNEGWL